MLTKRDQTSDSQLFSPSGCVCAFCSVVVVVVVVVIVVVVVLCVYVQVKYSKDWGPDLGLTLPQNEAFFFFGGGGGVIVIFVGKNHDPKPKKN